MVHAKGQHKEIFVSYKAPELIVSEWLNTNEVLSLNKLTDKVVAIHAFQMLCPGCVLHGVPQAQKVSELFDPQHVQVIGLHTVFEHHEAMGPESLKAFLHEFRITFPVAIDQAAVGNPIPKTMELYEMRGTPTWILISRKGELYAHIFGKIDDLVLGAEISKLAYEGVNPKTNIYRKGSRK